MNSIIVACALALAVPQGAGESNTSASPSTASVTLSAAQAISWAAFPTDDQMAGMYPARALMNGIQGTATINCAINASGKFTSCDIVSQSPAGYGFGVAMIKSVFKYAAVDTAQFNGDHVILTMNFKPRKDAAASDSSSR